VYTHSVKLVNNFRISLRVTPWCLWLLGLYGCNRALFVWFSWKVHANELLVTTVLMAAVW